uniref:Dynein light chain roadblock n=1 Tax=Tetraselmis sp. GSL018 TaxID=582737 RepID=A0A061QR32_9CHLO|mmetsp:Transcript_28443/g.67718  ORF Transcript_28443/g.67718 Transcript_28443/m.67718 type:complete len:105 (-) Transcript_28443:196-510(-)|eukprot:CAMPEP_0177621888 /NCGR_PEP_ID=MMETSP0419_2-20121207/27882_1 /TAXON_ID=582737 /ORGANISM="Tetraselmis sp., Strain GSL018" /LENGTH=104 /DNA_ID=CAMNT_0019121949 /DNA_START=198 /DNA_END=512 /DNA_ORIENTATION=+
MSDIAQVEETIKRISSHKGVKGSMIINGDGIAIRTTMSNEDTVQHAALISRFTEKARSCVRATGEEDELQFVRVRSKKHEIIIAPSFESNQVYYLVVIQDPSTQ